jgi:hypothetical protein
VREAVDGNAGSATAAATCCATKLRTALLELTTLLELGAVAVVSCVCATAGNASAGEPGGPDVDMLLTVDARGVPRALPGDAGGAGSLRTRTAAAAASAAALALLASASFTRAAAAARAA